ncbi:hypothetical protein Kpol_1048p23 [Vanderwaltozyma polyspora DSM 70294]|uniref:Nudix hydrolase domain-containing protein n=1 Tax=Vanderwaltozyma polyspora (strain ATCC 22028 / DSM 70294 / BCRC 21397 / CBS 2163 / NBRC 10782 / NRRL Y-8283 / UCD 57-17) TaxID=436907 RepID=A7TGI6_VANPO|nr:uncharacterized protein Kpol_1048p23 [Vanderwaltozyma polyspora DSM 70294]EDO18593.1 hypothetical protein Kpol_1048p23 [Vanderwaltozyma polyspora DSM 70294]
MSLPLRHSIETETSLDRILEDLLVRFILNVPPEDLSSVERELFHFEEASWFYTDFIKLINPQLPSLKIKSFATNIIRMCPLVWKWDIKADQALQKFSLYKKSIPVRGAAIFNERFNKILLVKGTESDTWSFPRGKISKDEDDVQCCIREVKEEIGFDLTDYIDENQFIERNISGKNYKIFLVSKVPESTQFKPQVRNEIEKIEWKDFKKITKSVYKSTTSTKYYLINSMIRPLSMWCRRQKQNKGDDQLKKYAEEQLKLLLGIPVTDESIRNIVNGISNDNLSEHEFIASQNEINNQMQPPSQTPQHGLDLDPGRALLDSLQSAFNSNQQQSFIPLQLPPQNPNNVMFPMMNNVFQPFTPYPFVNSNNGNIMFNANQLPPLRANVTSTLDSQNQMDENMGNNSLPLTPNINSLSRPSIVQTSGSNDAKQLLSLLKEKKEPVSGSSTFKLLKRGESFPQQTPDTNSSSSKDLLNILQNSTQKQPIQTQSSYQAESQTNTQIEQDSDEDYEAFESSSDEEEQEQLEELNSDEIPNQINVPKDILSENQFRTNNLDIPHKDNKDDSTMCEPDLIVSTPPVVENKPKQKIKLLRRGETLDKENLLSPPSVFRESLPYSADRKDEVTSAKPLMEMLKKPLQSSTAQNQYTPSPTTTSTSTTAAAASTISSNPLLDLLKGPVRGNGGSVSPTNNSEQFRGSSITQSFDSGSIAQSNAHELLNVLNSPPSHKTNDFFQPNMNEPNIANIGDTISSLPRMVSSPSQYQMPINNNNMISQNHPPPGLPPLQSQSSANQFLNILNGGSPAVGDNIAYSPFGGQISQNGPNSNSASNQLLNILHRK